MSWPANCPGLNCIENLWSWLDHNLGKIKIKDLLKDQLKEEVLKLPNNVSKDITQ